MKRIINFLNSIKGKNLTKILFTEGVMKIINISLLPLYLNLMSKEEYANYGFIVSFIGSAAAIANLSFSTYQSKYTYNNTNPKLLFDKLIGTSLLLCLIIFVPIYVFTDKEVLFKKLLGISGIGHYYGFIALGISTSTIFLTIKTFLYPTNRVSLYQNTMLVIGILLHVFSLISFVFLDLHRDFLRLGVFATIFLLGFIFLTKKIKFRFQIFSLKELRGVLKITLPLIIGSFASIIINLIDRYILNTKDLYNTVADLNLALTLTLFISFASASINDTFQIDFFGKKNLHQGIKILMQKIKLTTSTNILLSISIYIITYTAILLKVLPEDYKSIMIILPFVLLSKSVVSVTNLITHTYLFLDKTKYTAAQSIILSVLSIPISIVLIEKYQTIGAGLSLVSIAFLGLILNCILVYYLIQKH